MILVYSYIKGHHQYLDQYQWPKEAFEKTILDFEGIKFFTNRPAGCLFEGLEGWPGLDPIPMASDWSLHLYNWQVQ